MNKKLVFGLTCAVLVLSLCACDGPKFPYGTFAVEQGDEVLTFTRDGKCIYAVPAQGLSDAGTCSFKGNEVTFLTGEYCASLGINGSGIYTWTYENDTLIFSLKGLEPCGVRRDSLNLVRWHLLK